VCGEPWSSANSLAKRHDPCEKFSVLRGAIKRECPEMTESVPGQREDDLRALFHLSLLDELDLQAELAKLRAEPAEPQEPEPETPSQVRSREAASR
jgi:hypothetical protein